MELLLVSKRMALAKEFFLSLFNHWNISVTKLQIIKVWVSSSGKQYSQHLRDLLSLSKCFQKYGSTTNSRSSLQYLHLNLSNTKVLLGHRLHHQVCSYMSISSLGGDEGALFLLFLFGLRLWLVLPRSFLFPGYVHFRLALCKLFSTKQGHLLTKLYLPQDSRELGLVNAGKKQVVGVGEDW